MSLTYLNHVTEARGYGGVRCLAVGRFSEFSRKPWIILFLLVIGSLVLGKILEAVLTGAVDEASDTAFSAGFGWIWTIAIIAFLAISLAVDRRKPKDLLVVTASSALILHEVAVQDDEILFERLEEIQTSDVSHIKYSSQFWKSYLKIYYYQNIAMFEQSLWSRLFHYNGLYSSGLSEMASCLSQIPVTDKTNYPLVRSWACIAGLGIFLAAAQPYLMLWAVHKIRSQVVEAADIQAPDGMADTDAMADMEAWDDDRLASDDADADALEAMADDMEVSLAADEAAAAADMADDEAYGKRRLPQVELTMCNQMASSSTFLALAERTPEGIVTSGWLGLDPGECERLFVAGANDTENLMGAFGIFAVSEQGVVRQSSEISLPLCINEANSFSIQHELPISTPCTVSQSKVDFAIIKPNFDRQRQVYTAKWSVAD